MSGLEDEVPPPPPPSSPPPIKANHSNTLETAFEQSYAAPAEAWAQPNEFWQADQSQYGSHEAYASTYAHGYMVAGNQQEAQYAAPLPPAKRQKTDDDSMASALKKISVHISNPKKFLKASPLLRQLFTEGKLSGAHGDLVFECLRGAMRNVEAAAERMDLRKEYIKLFSIASNNSQIFSAREKIQLDVYGLLAVLRNQIQTDDSFVLNRILARIKDSIRNLPDADESDDQVLQEFQERSQRKESALATKTDSAEENIEGNSASKCIETQNRDDVSVQQGEADVVTGGVQEESAWSEQESLCMKRDALIACLEAAKEMHSKQWARTSVEIAFEEAFKQSHKLCTPQRGRLESLARFAQGQRLARKQGRAAAKEDRRDRTAFETARREWSKTAGISNRKAVGSGGDHHSEVWLG